MPAPPAAQQSDAPGRPAEPNDTPYPLTFFLRARQRVRVLAALRPLDADRARALLKALGLDSAELENNRDSP